MASGPGVPKPRREHEENRQVHRERWAPAPRSGGGSMEGQIMGVAERHASERLAQMFTPFKSYNATRGPNERWPGERP
jgi:hypothetical protein